MNFKTITKNGYKLHFLKTNKFNTVLVKIVFWNKLKKEDLTLRNMLVNNLIFSSFNYNTSRKMAIKKEELYSAELYSNNYRRGTHIISEINLSMIEDKYTEKNALNKSLEFLFDILNNPNVENNAFSEKPFDIIKERLRNAIISEQDSPTYLAYKKFKEMAFDDPNITSSILGNIEDLEAITSKTLYDYYKNFFRNNHIDIFVVGNINTNKIENTISKLFKPVTKEIEYLKVEAGYNKDYSFKEENSLFNQSKLILGGSIDSFTQHEKLYEAVIYNIILGSSPSSKLFRNVREKYSLAYNISSSINRMQGLFYVYAGISSKNYQKTKDEIEKQIEEMKKGKFTQKNLDSAKKTVISIAKETSEYQGSITDHYFNFLYLGNEKLAKQIEEFKKITKDDIVKVANKINIDTELLLKEKEINEDSNK